eukprot:758761_1
MVYGLSVQIFGVINVVRHNRVLEHGAFYRGECSADNNSGCNSFVNVITLRHNRSEQCLYESDPVEGEEEPASGSSSFLMSAMVSFVGFICCCAVIGYFVKQKGVYYNGLIRTFSN